METSSNIEKFDLIAGKAFSLLYESFPVPRGLVFGDFLEEEKVFTYDEKMMMDVPSKESDFVLQSLLWLMGSGFIQAKKSDFGLMQAVLTVKALEVLKQMPSSIASDDAKKTLGERLVDASKSGSKAALASAFNQALSIGVSALLRSQGISG